MSRYRICQASKFNVPARGDNTPLKGKEIREPRTLIESYFCKSSLPSASSILVAELTR